MATVKNDKYGIASSNAEKTIIKKMGVVDERIYPFHQSNQLFAKMMMGDTLCVASASCFAQGAYDLLAKMQYLSNRGIELQLGQEKYLDFTVTKALSDTTLETLRVLAQRESEFVQFVQSSRMPNSSKNVLVNRIRSEYLASIHLMFSNNGIKKKGN